VAAQVHTQIYQPASRGESKTTVLWGVRWGASTDIAVVGWRGKPHHTPLSGVTFILLGLGRQSSLIKCVLGVRVHQQFEYHEFIHRRRHHVVRLAPCWVNLNYDRYFLWIGEFASNSNRKKIVV